MLIWKSRWNLKLEHIRKELNGKNDLRGNCKSYGILSRSDWYKKWLNQIWNQVQSSRSTLNYLATDQAWPGPWFTTYALGEKRGQIYTTEPFKTAFFENEINSGLNWTCPLVGGAYNDYFKTYSLIMKLIIIHIILYFFKIFMILILYRIISRLKTL